MNYQEIISQMTIVVAILVVFVNIVTEVIKSVYNFKSAQSINVFVTILSIVMTVGCFVAYWQLKSLQLTWYTLIAFVVVGFMVAYGAMLGFDKLIKNFEWMK